MEAAALQFVIRWKKNRHFVACGMFGLLNPLGWDLYDVTVSIGM